jgi:hypothetical protein
MRSEDFVPLSSVFYLDGLDAYVRRRLKALSSFLARPGAPLIAPGGGTEVEKAILDIAEALVLGDGVALKITGENTVLALLVRYFGAEAIRELIDRKVIMFVAQRHDAAYLQDSSARQLPDGSAVPPGNPVFAAIDYAGFEPDVFTGQAFDGQQAALSALQRHRAELGIDRSELRAMTRTAARHTRIVPFDRLSEITNRVGKAYSDGSLSVLGLSPDIAREKNEYQDHACVSLIDRIAYCETLLDFDLNDYQMPDRWEDLRTFTAQVTSGNEVLRSVDHIVRLRGVADIRSLFRAGVFAFGDVVRIREHSATKAFRRWLWEIPIPATENKYRERLLLKRQGSNETKWPRR